MPGTNVKRVRRLCCAAMLAAMYLPLSLYAAVQVGTVRVASGSLPVVAAAFRQAIEAGRKAYLAGLGRVLTRGASASDPLTGFLRD